jgi:hypothetical protein
MCFSLFLAADQPLPLVAWHEERPGFCLTELCEQEASAREWFSKPFVYSVGGRMGCACSFTFDAWPEPTERDLAEWQENREDFRALAEYIRKLAAPVEMYGADDYYLPPLEQRPLRVDDLVGERFVFEERELLTIAPFDRSS